MTVAELISQLEQLDPARLVCIRHPDEARGYFPANDTVLPTVVGLGHNGETYNVASLELTRWPSDSESSDAPITCIVSGRWPFPLDMLRYDSCEGATDIDKTLIAELSVNTAPTNRGRTVIRVKKNPRHERDTQFNEARWNSFGWRIEK